MNDQRHDDFDRRMRALHARAVERVPSRTIWQLRVRSEAAARAPAIRRRSSSGWWLATAATATAVFALAIGLRQPEPSSLPADGDLPALASATEAVQAADYDESLAALDEDPDLYLWLAAQDSLILAME